MTGIQVDPATATRFAQERFGADYAQHVIELAQFQSFGEAASNKVEQLERENAELKEANARLNQQFQDAQTMVGQLRRQVELANAAAEAEHGVAESDPEESDREESQDWEDQEPETPPQ